eukprot:7614024-Pyramimonas_sp.AAC.1
MECVPEPGRARTAEVGGLRPWGRAAAAVAPPRERVDVPPSGLMTTWAARRTSEIRSMLGVGAGVPRAMKPGPRGP